MLTFKDFGLNKEEVNIPMEIQICCGKPCKLCMPITYVENFMQEVLYNTDSGICIAIYCDNSVNAVLKDNHGDFASLQDNIEEKLEVLKQTIKTFNIENILILQQNGTDENGVAFDILQD